MKLEKIEGIEINVNGNSTIVEMITDESADDDLHLIRFNFNDVKNYDKSNNGTNRNKTNKQTSTQYQHWGYADKIGSIVINPIYFSASSFNNQGYAKVKKHHKDYTHYAYINKKGEEFNIKYGFKIDNYLVYWFDNEYERNRMYNELMDTINGTMIPSTEPAMITAHHQVR